jgi:hypothetical protein
MSDWCRSLLVSRGKGIFAFNFLFVVYCMNEREEALKDYAGTGKYHQMAMALEQMLEEGVSPEDTLALYEKHALPIYYNMNHDSLSSIACSIADGLGERERGRELLERTLFLLANTPYSPEKVDSLIHSSIEEMKRKAESAVVRVLLGIAKQAVEGGDMARGKNILYDSLKIQIDANDLLSALHYGLGILHFHSANYTQSFNNLVEFIRISPNMNTAATEKCALSALLSPDIFTFNGLLQLCVEETNFPLELLRLVNAGDTLSIEKSREAAGKKDREKKELYRIALRKAKITLLLNHCFNNQNRESRLSDLEDQLDIERDEAEKILLEVLGLGLVRGYIDNVEGVFYYEWVGYKVLNVEEIHAARLLVSSLKERVQELLKGFPAQS